jgi:signal peptide peptidase SppA
VPVLSLRGILSARAGALNIDAYGPMIDAAMRSAKGATLLLDIDSPGGSPVQSDLIASRIRRRADEHGVKVRAVVAEVGASGGYWLACAADEIVANPMSIVGSIGVVGGGFGFPQAMSNLGVERRLYTAGDHKRRLDPFLPEKPDDLDFVRGLLDELHARFKTWVRTRRGARLTADESAVFDGGYMLGERAQTLGLIDRLGDLDGEVKALGGAKARPRLFKPRRRSLLSRLPRMMADALFDAAEERTRPGFRM